MTDAEAVLRWLLALTAISAAFFPAVCWLGRALGESASAMVRPLALVFITALVWWPASALGVPFSRVTLLATLGVSAAIVWYAWRRSNRKIPWQALLAFEAVWLALFAAYVVFRSYHPDIANTEKPMEIALLSSVSRSTEVPAADPWFAGESINYYYFGYQMIAALVKVSGVPPAIAFNLALATLFASVGTVAAGIGFHLGRRLLSSRLMPILAAAAASFFTLLAGNLETARRFLSDPSGTWQYRWWYDGAGWEASRVIVDEGVHGVPGQRQTINEFPAFSFVLGDLHPHVLTYPLLLCVVAICVGVMSTTSTFGLWRAATAGALAGLLYVSNSWDAPLGLLLIAVAIVATAGWRSRQAWTQLGVALAGALVVALPFLLTFSAPVGTTTSDLPEALRDLPLLGRVFSTVGIVTWRPSSVGELLTVHGHWLVAFIVFIALVGSSAVAEYRTRLHPALLVTALVVAAIIAVAWSPALLLVGLPLAASLAVAAGTRQPAVRAVALLYAGGWFLILVPEYIYIQDAFGDRMNTVFKLYFQAWALLALATAGTVALVLGSRQSGRRMASSAALAVIAVATLLYTPISARDWTSDFAERQGLDGSSYLLRASPDDAAAIAWLNEHAEPDDVLVEGPGCSYQSVAGVPTSRVSAFTGVPTLIGWEGHERQWRRAGGGDLETRIDTRQDAANRFLGGDEALALNLPEPDIIFLGSVEAAGSESCEPLVAHHIQQSRQELEEQGWRVVFQSGDTMILRR